jgi:hypothetical protein
MRHGFTKLRLGVATQLRLGDMRLQQTRISKESNTGSGEQGKQGTVQEG